MSDQYGNLIFDYESPDMEKAIHFFKHAFVDNRPEFCMRRMDLIIKPVVAPLTIKEERELAELEEVLCCSQR